MTPLLGFQFTPPDVNLALILPELIVSIAAVIVMLVDAFAKPTQRWLTGGISLAGLGAAGLSSLWLWNSRGVAGAFNGMIVLDGMRLGFTFVFLLVAALVIIVSIF